VLSCDFLSRQRLCNHIPARNAGFSKTAHDSLAPNGMAFRQAQGPERVERREAPLPLPPARRQPVEGDLQDAEPKAAGSEPVEGHPVQSRFGKLKALSLSKGNPVHPVKIFRPPSA